jgi:ferredoxin
MEARILQRDRLLELVDALAQDHEVIAPKDDLAYAQVSSGSEVYIVEDKPTRSLKEYFFPQREVLLEYVAGTNGVELTAPPPALETKRIIFGARPCDVAAFPILDKLFSWDYVDSSYVEARKRSVFVSIACEQPCETCFCVSLDGSPAGIEGTDLLLTPVGDVYHVQLVTDRGKSLVEEYSAFFGESEQKYDQARVQFEENAVAKITKEVNIDGLDKTLDFAHPIWEMLAQQCIDCGICTFLCPTCHCFDIQDEGNPAQGERVRLWDACMFYGYTKAHAGQPRPTHYRRYRQRIMHKFRYYPENFGNYLCVGCGRCIEHCPVNIDLRDVLEAVKE